MSKKFLAVLIALSMTGFYACDDDNNDGGSSCTANTCNGTKLQICSGGKVVLEKDCGALGCNAMLGQCNSSSQPTCDTATVSAQCTSLGQVFDAASCSCKPNGTVDPNPNPGTGVVGSACDRNTYKQTCINNGANALVCWDDVVTQWDCGGGCQDAGYNPAKPLQVNCQKGSSGGGDPSNTLPNPKGDSTVAGASCDPGTYYGACSDDFTKRYYCGKDNTVVENSCNNGCDPASLGNNGSKCKSGGGGGGSDLKEGGNVGDACDRNVYKQTCINSGANALVCWDNKVAQWNCKDSQCQDAGYDPQKPLQVNCPKDSSGSGGGDPSNTLPNPKGDSTVSGASCDPGTYYGACSDDFTKRYYCGKDNTVVENSCNNGCDPASLGNNSSKCKSGGGSTCTGEKVTTGGTAGESCCDTATYQVSCINSNANALICSGGTVKQWDCANSQCSVADNKVTCPQPGAEACDPATYVPSCESAALGHRCSSSGSVADWTCKTGTCTVHTDGNCTKANSNCVDGKYDKEKFATGFIECVD